MPRYEDGFLVYKLFCGSIPLGRHLHHKCHNRSCCNPRHLEPVTPFENIERSPKGPTFVNRHRTHCSRGHEFTSENTYIDRRKGR